MNVFVTGGAGYVGSHCVRELCAAGHTVAVYDNLVSGGHAAAVDPRATLIVGDLADTGLLADSLAGVHFDAVMHFAAALDVYQSTIEPLLYYRNNVVNSVSLLELMRENDIKNIVFSSSCAVYGVPAAVPITEDMPRVPINPYGRTKVAIEWALCDCAAAWGLGATALRYFNAAGAAEDGSIGEDHHPECHLIPRVLKVALGLSDRLTIFGTDYPTRDGTCVRDYVHVEDLAGVHRMAIESQETGRFRAYNVGTGAGVSVQELLDSARDVTGHGIPAVESDRRQGDPPELVANPAKVIEELGWRPRYTDIRETIATAWRWHRAHPGGFFAR